MTCCEAWWPKLPIRLSQCCVVSALHARAGAVISPACPALEDHLMLQLQVRYPDRITLIRGNHESRQITQVLLICSLGSGSIWGSLQHLKWYLLYRRCMASMTSA